MKARVICLPGASLPRREIRLFARLLAGRLFGLISDSPTTALKGVRAALLDSIGYRVLRSNDALYPYFLRMHQWLLVADAIPDCDINVATYYETALPVYLSKKGKQFYFMQHFEEVFAQDSSDPALAHAQARLSYLLPPQKIVNSTWLRRVVKEKFWEDVPVLNNAIDHTVFYALDRREPGTRKRVISYGGRNAQWKGFADAVEAMKLVRRERPEVEWVVYGSALIPPDNPDAPYTHVPKAVGKELAKLYRSADVCLCAAWYESFPAYPLEAMACGTPVVTTPYGTEDYAFHEVNSLVVPPRDPAKMAEAVLRILNDDGVARRLREEGIKTAKQFTWEKSIDRMEAIFLEALESPEMANRQHEVEPFLTSFLRSAGWVGE